MFQGPLHVSEDEVTIACYLASLLVHALEVSFRNLTQWLQVTQAFIKRKHC